MVGWPSGSINFVIGNIYQAQNNTFKQQKNVKFVNPNGKVKGFF